MQRGEQSSNELTYRFSIFKYLIRIVKQPGSKCKNYIIFKSDDLFLTAHVQQKLHVDDSSCGSLRFICCLELAERENTEVCVHTVQYSNSETDRQGETHILWHMSCVSVGLFEVQCLYNKLISSCSLHLNLFKYIAMTFII